MQFLISLVITLLVVGIVCGALTWIVSTAPFIPEPMKGIAKWVILVIGVLYLLAILIGMVPGIPVPQGGWRH